METPGGYNDTTPARTETDTIRGVGGSSCNQSEPQLVLLVALHRNRHSAGPGTRCTHTIDAYGNSASAVRGKLWHAPAPGADIGNGPKQHQRGGATAESLPGRTAPALPAAPSKTHALPVPGTHHRSARGPGPEPSRRFASGTTRAGSAGHRVDSRQPDDTARAGEHLGPESPNSSGRDGADHPAGGDAALAASPDAGQSMRPLLGWHALAAVATTTTSCAHPPPLVYLHADRRNMVLQHWFHPSPHQKRLALYQDLGL